MIKCQKHNWLSKDSVCPKCVEEMDVIPAQIFPSAASVGSQVQIDEALTVQAMRIAAAVRKWGLDADGILREFVGEVRLRERALAARESISL